MRFCRPQFFMLMVSLFSINYVFAQIEYYGVNLAAADFGENNLPGTFNVDYTYPTQAEVNYFMGKGMNVFRLPFRWERLQNDAYEALNSAEQTRMDNFINYATGQGAAVVLDPHNYARYFGVIIGSANLEVEAFEDFWSKLANHYKDNAKVIFAIMNEPNTMSSELWRDDANAAIRAIRRTGAANLILVPGNGWTGAHSWAQNWYGTANAIRMLEIVDSLDNMAFDVHQYFDSNYSGTSSTCQSASIGSQKLVDFTNWARNNGKKGFLGEFGAADNATCDAAVAGLLDYMIANSDVWLGWTWWAAGPWWGNYHYSIEPSANLDAPQMAILEQYIGVASAIGTSGRTVLPADYILTQNYPNPFNPSTIIDYQIAESNYVTLKVYNAQGKEIVTLVNDYQGSGYYTIKFNAAGLASGVYFYKLQAGNFVELKKMLFIK